MIKKDECATSFVKKTYAWYIESVKELLKMKHSFTHFHLHIQAMALKIDVSKNSLLKGSGHWFRYDERLNLGLSKPVSSIIQFFYQSNTDKEDESN